MSKKKNEVIRRGIALYIDGKEVKNDLRTLQAELKRAKEEIKGMTVGSREYLEQLKKIKDLNTIIKEHQAKLREVNEETKKFSLSKGVDIFNKYAASATALVAALTGVVLKLNSFRKMMHEREDAKANVKSLTGLDDESINWRHTVPYDGMCELLHRLRSEGVQVAVASNKFQHGTDRLVAKFFGDIDFVAIEGNREGAPLKPDPQIVNNILAKAGVEKQHAVMIGDSGIDIRTAAAAGIDAIGVAWGFRFAEELYDAGAECVVTTVAELESRLFAEA